MSSSKFPPEDHRLLQPLQLPRKQLQMLLALFFSLLIIWSVAFHDLQRTRNSDLHEAEQIAVFQAQAFAVNARSAIQRIDDLSQQLRFQWLTDRVGFSEFLIRHKRNTEKVALQIGIIGADGHLIYSNMSSAEGRLYLGDREHFRVHLDPARGDQLFISQPVKGRVSGKSSIQFSRPIHDAQGFAGVIVISARPQAFLEFGENTHFAGGEFYWMLNGQGTVLARYPQDDGGGLLKSVDWPILKNGGLLSGHFMLSEPGTTNRMLGYFRVPEYDLYFAVERNEDDALHSYLQHRQVVLGVSAAASLIVALLIILQFRAARVSELAQRKLVESQNMLWSAIDTIGEAFVIYDQNDRLVYCNERYRAYYPTSAPMIQPGNTFEEIIRYGVACGQYPEAKGREEAWIEDRLERHLRGNTEIIQRTDNGRWLRILENTSPEGFRVGFRVDITELYEAKQLAESANRAKSDFLATMSHEIRTPMNGVLGVAQLLLTPQMSQDERLRYAKIIWDCSQNLLELLNDLLDLSKVEAGQVELERRVFSLRLLIDELVVHYGETIRGKGLAFEVRGNLPEEPFHLWGDRLRLRQILGNLLSNAIKFTEQGRIELEVLCLPPRAGENIVRFVVKDNGIGIPADKLDRLFKNFSQVDSSITRRFGGSGLGLAIIKHLVGLMGGRVGVDSVVGAGSSFWVELPLEPASPEAVAAAEPERGSLPPLRQPGNAAGQHILVVEDTRINSELLEILLEKQGYRVSTVRDGHLALDWLANNPAPDLVLMDCHMPVMDGLEATRQIRLREKREQCAQPLRIIALTAGAFDSDRVACLSAGMNDYLSKPIHFAALHAMLDRYLPSSTLPQDDLQAVPDVPPLPQSSAINVAAALERLGGDRAIYLRFAAAVPEQLQLDHAQIRQQLDAGDAAALHKSCHRLKGVLGILGAERAQAACDALDAAASVSNLEACPSLLAELDAAVIELNGALTVLLADSAPQVGRS